MYKPIDYEQDLENEIEFGTKHKTRFERQREAYEEAEREGNHGYII